MSLIRKLSSADVQFDSQLATLLLVPECLDEGLDQQVLGIIRQVKIQGDSALLEFTHRWDHLTVSAVSELEVSSERLALAFNNLPLFEREALQAAHQRIEFYHQKQKQVSWRFRDELGNELGQEVRPLDRVGIYVPGGKASYPSSVLMNAIPAKVAGVQEIIMAVPTPRGEVNELVLAAAFLSGVTRAFCIGGAQAIAALAYGTQTIPRVDKIVGPGNKYVASAKKQVFGQVGIDMIAGPSEILIYGDGVTPAEWIALDLFAQAEHDEMAQSLFMTTKKDYLLEVEAAILRLIDQQPRGAIIRQSLKDRGALMHIQSESEALELINRIAPEHLELAVSDPARLLPFIRHAGAIFMGSYSAEALGDYCAGPNHVLPTSGTARFASPLGVYDFQKRSSIIHCSAHGASELAKIAGVLARGESLSAHAESAERRKINT